MWKLLSAVVLILMACSDGLDAELPNPAPTRLISDDEAIADVRDFLRGINISDTTCLNAFERFPNTWTAAINTDGSFTVQMTVPDSDFISEWNYSPDNRLVKPGKFTPGC